MTDAPSDLVPVGNVLRGTLTPAAPAAGFPDDLQPVQSPTPPPGSAVVPDVPRSGPEVAQEAPSASARGPDWKSLYAGLDGLDSRLTPPQRDAFEFLDAKSAEPQEARARAINQAYVIDWFSKNRQGGISDTFVANNWDTVKNGYAKEVFGVVKDKISDTEFYGMARKQVNAPSLWEVLNTPFKEMPDLTETPGQYHTPITFYGSPVPVSGPIAAGVYKGVIKPFVESLESPMGVATFGAGAELKALSGTYKAAKMALVGMSGLFAGLMAKQTVSGVGEAKRVLDDPNSSTEDKIAAVSSPVATGLMGLMGALGAVFEALPDKGAKLGKAMEGKSIEEIPAMLTEESAKAETPEQKAAIHTATEEFQKLTEHSALPPPEPAAEPLPVADADAKTEAPPPEQPKPTAKSERAPGSLVGIKNEVVDEEMRKMGLDPAEHGTSLSWEQAKADADAKIAADPFAGQKLVRSLADSPRPITGQEDALLLTEVNRLKLERDAAEAQLIEAKRVGDRDAEAEANVRIAAARDAFTVASETATKVGTPQAQGLALRRMMMREDYSISSMERQLSAATETGKLTPDQVDQIRGLSKHIRETAEALEKKAKKALSPEAKQKMLKGALRAQIDAMDKEIQKGEKSASKRGKVKGDDETQRLKELRDALKGAHDVMFPEEEAKPLTAEQQLTQALAAKDRQIEELQRQLDTQEPFSPGKEQPSTDPRMEAKQAKIDALKEEREYLRDSLQTPKDPPTDIETRAKELDQRIAAIEKQLKNEAPFSKGKKAQPTSPELAAKAATLEALKEQREYMRDRLQPSTDPKTKAEKALAAYKTRTAASTKDLLRRVRENDLAPKPKPEPIQFDPEAENLRGAHERAKQDFERLVLETRMQNRGMFENAQNILVKWRRGFLLSSPVSIVKLTAAAAWRLGATIAEEATGTALSKLPGVSKVAEGAPRYGAANSEALAAAITQASTQGMKDAWAILKTGKSNLDVIYGKGANSTVNEYDIASRSVIEYFGNLHGFLKAPIKRFAFALSQQKRLAFGIRNGVDVSNPLVKIRIDLEAYKDANAAIFLQDNMLTEAYKRGLSALEQVDPKTQKTKYASGKLTATAARVAFPITKVPTNIVGETIEYATGTLTGSWRLGKALHAGVETVSAEQKDLIMRNLQKGSLGAAALLLGYFSYKSVGGQYQQGQKLKPGQVKPGNVMVYDKELPSHLFHHPIMETVQLGATVRRVQETKLRKKDAETQGVGVGVWAAALGLLEEVPYARGAAEYTKLFDPRELQYETGQIAKDIVDPQILQWMARVTDVRDGVRVDRKPGTVGEAVKAGIPGLRQTVPEKKRDLWTSYKK